ncbi:LysR substrate-binding domain-containing protein [Herbaspirillum robiniae]|uniref:LysR substrate-binding domain-containing protein n=1 Tax=Herbaspirillum robiniae TaxID=2014887 RepID=UPI003D77FCAA
MHKLPPLTALRAFEATARLLSFTAAADELHVTQSAVSRQVRILEEFLQHKLFERLTRRIELTAQGAAYYEEIRQAFEKIAGAGSRLGKRRKSAALTIAVLPGVAALWLMPRLDAFWRAHRHVDVRIVVATGAADFRRSQVDMAIQVGVLPGARARGLPMTRRMAVDWHGLRADALFPDALVALCHPRLLRRQPVGKVADLARHCLIHTSIRPDAWQDWLGAHGGKLAPAQQTLECSQYAVSLQAAMNGDGIALAPKVLADSFDPQQRLRRLFDGATPSAGQYYLLTPASRYEEPHVRVFREWLLAQAAGLD